MNFIYFICSYIAYKRSTVVLSPFYALRKEIINILYIYIYIYIYIIYFIYLLNPRLRNLNTDFTLNDCVFESVRLTKNDESNK